MSPLCRTHQLPPPGATARAHRMKVEKYADWADKLGVDFAPMVFTPRATISQKTLDALRSLQRQATRRGFVNEVTRRIKVTLVEFEVTRRLALQARKRLGRLDTDVAITERRRFIDEFAAVIAATAD